VAFKLFVVFSSRGNSFGIVVWSIDGHAATELHFRMLPPLVLCSVFELVLAFTIVLLFSILLCWPMIFPVSCNPVLVDSFQRMFQSSCQHSTGKLFCEDE
jgi:hypothetical protein